MGGQKLAEITRCNSKSLASRLEVRRHRSTQQNNSNNKGHNHKSSDSRWGDGEDAQKRGDQDNLDIEANGDRRGLRASEKKID